MDETSERFQLVNDRIDLINTIIGQMRVTNQQIKDLVAKLTKEDMEVMKRANNLLTETSHEDPTN